MKIFEYVIVSICILGIIIFKVVHVQENRRIFKKTGFAIGYVEKYEPSDMTSVYIPKFVKKTPRAPTITYNYVIDSVVYVNHYSSDAYKIPPEGIELGSTYLVVYNLNNVKESRILFEFQINKNLNFEQIVSKYKN